MATIPEATLPKPSSDGKGSTKTGSTAAGPSAGDLTEEMLARFDSRAATYDRENRFFDQDFEELRATKYLTMPVPEKFGGAITAIFQQLPTKHLCPLVIALKF